MAFLKKRGDIWYVYWQHNGKKHGKSLKTKSKSVASRYLKEFEFKPARQELGRQDALQASYLNYCKSTKKASTYERHDVPGVNRFVEFLKDKGGRQAFSVFLVF